MMNSRHQQAGLSLIELMIALTLSLILFLGVYEVFSSSKKTSMVQHELARMQENARFALDAFGHSIRIAGQLGCNKNVHIENNTGSLLDFNGGLAGYEHSQLPAILLTGHGDNPAKADVIDGTDTLIVMWASPIGTPVTADDDNPFTKILIDDTNDIEQHDPLIISDCVNADIFTAGAITADTSVEIGKSEFIKKYENNAQLAKLNYRAYYVRKDGQGKNNLYLSEVKKMGAATGIDTDPLLEGVEDLQIEYGEDINGDNTSIRYVSAKTADMDRVVSVRIHLLLASEKKLLASEPQTYWFQGQKITAEDGDLRLFRSFTTTIQLRNQALDV